MGLLETAMPHIYFGYLLIGEDFAASISPSDNIILNANTTSPLSNLSQVLSD